MASFLGRAVSAIGDYAVTVFSPERISSADHSPGPKPSCTTARAVSPKQSESRIRIGYSSDSRTSESGTRARAQPQQARKPSAHPGANEVSRHDEQRLQPLYRQPALGVILPHSPPARMTKGPKIPTGYKPINNLRKDPLHGRQLQFLNDLEPRQKDDSRDHPFLRGGGVESPVVKRGRLHNYEDIEDYQVIDLDQGDAPVDRQPVKDPSGHPRSPSNPSPPISVSSHDTRPVSRLSGRQDSPTWTRQEQHGHIQKYKKPQSQLPLSSFAATNQLADPRPRNRSKGSYEALRIKGIQADPNLFPVATPHPNRHTKVVEQGPDASSVIDVIEDTDEEDQLAKSGSVTKHAHHNANKISQAGLHSHFTPSKVSAPVLPKQRRHSSHDNPKSRSLKGLVRHPADEGSADELGISPATNVNSPKKITLNQEYHAVKPVEPTPGTQPLLSKTKPGLPYDLEACRSWGEPIEASNGTVVQMFFDDTSNELGLRSIGPGPQGWNNMCTVDHSKATKCSTDYISRVRLEGPLLQEFGDRRYWWDFIFKHQNQLKDFVDNRIRKVTAMRKINQRSPVHMAKIMENPPGNPIPRAPSTVGEAEELRLLEARTQKRPGKEGVRPAKKETLVSQLRPNTSAIEPKRLPRDHAQLPQPSEEMMAAKLTRRSNRRTDTVDIDDDQYDLSRMKTPPAKLDLGPKWDKPVTYSLGRQTAVVDFEDLHRLEEGEYLNDNLIEFYMLYLLKKFNLLPKKVYAFNTHFYTSLTRPVRGQRGGINYAAVSRWTSKVDIFEYDYIMVPVNENAHWYLVLICNVPNIKRTLLVEDSEKGSSPVTTQAAQRMEDTISGGAVSQSESPKQGAQKTCSSEDDDPMLFSNEDGVPLVGSQVKGKHDLQPAPSKENIKPPQLADSIRESGLLLNSATVENKKKSKRKSGGIVRNPDDPVILVLDSLGDAHPNTVRNIKDYLIQEGQSKRQMQVDFNQSCMNVKNIPMQKNLVDCGVFVLGYMQRFLQDPRYFTTKVVTREMDESDWPEMNPSIMRVQLRSTLQGLAREQYEDRVRIKAEKRAQRTGVPESSTPHLQAARDAHLPKIETAKSPSRGPQPSPKVQNRRADAPKKVPLQEEISPKPQSPGATHSLEIETARTPPKAVSAVREGSRPTSQPPFETHRKNLDPAKTPLKTSHYFREFTETASAWTPKKPEHTSSNSPILKRLVTEPLMKQAPLRRLALV
ncbi:hypothetical protein GQ43DRAFT_208739 [Delitschia confertaspora ATCC 74209]|uniref:Ubiquitin-like protease family profile domain-containing protein n=1 Tax=Delitschia confertaspora ATCC 74209 TaxID=1513339 RepID=A0A9P4MRV4_9PLEO|nr:hypothetical protein GQ43DRAFT_208739 [Delitschia confertaspora ATCC 74209]